jgi:hypothetical protein
MKLPILMHHGAQIKIGSAEPVDDGLRVAMNEGYELTHEQIGQTFGYAGVRVIDAKTREDNEPVVREFVISEFMVVMRGGRA